MDNSDIMTSNHPPVSPNVDIHNHFILLQKMSESLMVIVNIKVYTRKKFQRVHVTYMYSKEVTVNNFLRQRFL